jgi:hypothetical protein
VAKKQRALPNAYRWWHVRQWYGMTSWAWLRLLWTHGCRFSFSRLYRVVLVSAFSVIHSLSAIWQSLRFGRRIADQELPPLIFIIGHWRTGTTFLHELLSIDPRFSSPDTLQCMCPEHFLVSRRWIEKLAFLIPKKRPMDNVALRFDAPQEDEFALLTMGAGSPMEMTAFPGARSRWAKWYRVPERSRVAWRRKLERFLRTITFAQHRATGVAPMHLLLKSPTHTGRLGWLAEAFPDARFVHLVREPVSLFSSAQLLLRAMFVTQALNVTDVESEALLEESVFANFDSLYQHFDSDCAGLSPNRLLTLKYEDIKASPMQQVEQIYEFLNLDLSPDTAACIANELAARKQYRPNRHAPDAELEKKVRQRWFAYRERYGYS